MNEFTMQQYEEKLLKMAEEELSKLTFAWNNFEANGNHYITFWTTRDSRGETVMSGTKLGCLKHAILISQTETEEVVEEESSSEQDDNYEIVDHPQHYGGENSKHEAISVIEEWNLGFHLGNVVKYISRAGKKPDQNIIDDLKKARWYLDRFIEKNEEKHLTTHS